MRRAWRRAAYRRRAGHSRQGAHAAQGRHRAVGEIELALLHADARGPGQALQVHARHQMEGPAEKDAGCDPPWLRRHRDPLFLRRRRARLRNQAAVRRHHHQSRAPLPRDRFRMGARGDRPLFHRRAVRGLQRLSPQARSVVRQDRRAAYRRSLRLVGQGRGRVVRRGAGPAQRQAERNRGAHPQRDPRPAEIFDRCRARLPDIGPGERHAVRRREPAHPACLADRLRPDRRFVRARRAFDRAASARQ